MFVHLIIACIVSGSYNEYEVGYIKSCKEMKGS